jgi:lipopolysaccharide cholinephosphotransferase
MDVFKNCFPSSFKAIKDKIMESDAAKTDYNGQRCFKFKKGEGFMNEQILQKIKELELEILKYVDKICKENGLKYYLVGGTLLGAIRHKGFIPWDDDIDIAMFRDDYNEFIEIAIKDNDPKLFIQTFNTDSNYIKHITKIRLNGTKFIEKAVEMLDMHHGIFIDIFPLDKINKEKEKTIDFRANIAAIMIKAKYLKVGLTTGPTTLKTLRNKLLKGLLTIIPLSFLNSLIDVIYGCSNHNNAKYVTNYGSQYGWRKQTFPIEVYGEGVLVTFEGHEFMAPCQWETILKSLYGDYMKLPPVEKRTSGHNVVKVDLGAYKDSTLDLS